MLACTSEAAALDVEELCDGALQREPDCKCTHGVNADLVNEVIIIFSCSHANYVDVLCLFLQDGDTALDVTHYALVQDIIRPFGKS